MGSIFGSQFRGPIVLCVCLCALASAQQSSVPTPDPDQLTAVPNRPTISSTAECVQRGVFETEIGFEAADGHQNINSLWKFGVTRNLEVRFANLPFDREDGVAAFGDSQTGFKYRVFPQSKFLPTFSILYMATLPTAGHNLGASAFGHSFTLLASKDFGKHHFDWNEGLQLVGRPQPGPRGFDRNYFSALAYSHPLTNQWGLSGEVAGYSRTNLYTPANLTLLAAATYGVSSRLVIDGGAYYAAFGNLPRVTFFSGFTYSIADLYRKRR